MKDGTVPASYNGVICVHMSKCVSETERGWRERERDRVRERK